VHLVYLIGGQWTTRGDQEKGSPVQHLAGVPQRQPGEQRHAATTIRVSMSSCSSKVKGRDLSVQLSCCVSC